MTNLFGPFIEKVYAVTPVPTGIAPILPTDTGAAAPAQLNATNFALNVNKLFGNVIALIGTIMAIAAVGYILWSAFQYITSAGSPDKTKTARAAIINVVIGIIVFVVSFTIVRLSLALGTNIFNGL